MRSSLQIVFGILFFLPLSQHTVLHAEIPSKVDVVAEIVQSLSQIDPKDRLELFYIVGRDAAQLTEEEWEPIHRLCKEAATANFAQSGAPGELVRDYAPGVALIQCGGIKSADSKDMRYMQLASFRDGVATSRLAREVASIALKRIRNSKIRQQAAWSLADSSPGLSFDEVKSLCTQAVTAADLKSLQRNGYSTSSAHALVDVLCRYMPEQTDEVIKLVTQEIDLSSDERLLIAREILSRAKDKLGAEQAKRFLNLTADQIPSCSNPASSASLIIHDLARLLPSRAAQLIDRYELNVQARFTGYGGYGQTLSETDREKLLALLRSDKDLAKERLQLKLHGWSSRFPLARSIMARNTSVAQAQRYVDALLQIAEGLGDEDCTRNTFLVLVSIGREGVRIPGSQAFLRDLDVDALDWTELRAIISACEESKQREILRKAFPTKQSLANQPDAKLGSGQENWYLLRSEVGGYSWRNVNALTAGGLAVKSSIPIEQKRKYFRRLVRECENPMEKFQMGRFIATFDACFALETFWNVRGELSGKVMSGCGTMVRWSGYGSTSWPDDDLAWLQELLGFHWREGLGEGLWSAGYGAFLDRGPETSRDEVDRMLIRGIDQFLPQVSKIEERESLLLYRLGAHARLGDLEATHAAAKQLSKPEKRAYGYSAVLQMLTPQEE